MVQTLAVHTCRAPQTRPHIPQLFRSLRRSRQAPEQLVIPAPHWSTQAPAVQASLDPHTRPQAPQFALSLCRLRHTPEQRV